MVFRYFGKTCDRSRHGRYVGHVRADIPEMVLGCILNKRDAGNVILEMVTECILHQKDDGIVLAVIPYMVITSFRISEMTVMSLHLFQR